MTLTGRTSITLGIMVLATLADVTLISSTAHAGTFNYQPINNAADPAFNQLLGINNSGTIVGYDGDAVILPNKGYSLVSPYGAGSYTNENFPASAQTQVVGINNGASPTTVGFWVDGNGNNFGFSLSGGTFTSFTDPNAVGPITTTQLLGVNSSNIAAGFYVNGAGNTQGFTVNLATNTYTAVNLPASFNAVSVTATGVNNAGVISGFYLDAGGFTHGFIDDGGVFTSYDDPNGTNTMFLGLNDDGQVVGSYVDINGETQGFLFTISTLNWQTISDPFASAIVNGFNVDGTTVNGINDNGQLVGFYGDGTNVDGFLATPVPEPAPVALIAIGVALVGGLCWMRKPLSA